MHKRPPIHFASLSFIQWSPVSFPSGRDCKKVSVWGSVHFIDEKAGELHPRAHPSTNAPIVAGIYKKYKFCIFGKIIKRILSLSHSIVIGCFTNMYIPANAAKICGPTLLFFSILDGQVFGNVSFVASGLKSVDQ